MLLSLAGAAGDIGLAWYVVRLLPRLLPPGLLLFALREATFDGRVFEFTGIVGIVTGLLCSLAPALRAARTSIIEGLVVTNGKAVLTPRFYLILLSLFAGLALVTASIGLYGITMFTISRRTQEIGLRIAVGAGPHDVRFLVVRQALAPVLLGMGGGLIGAACLTRFMRTLLYQIEPQDPLTLVAVSITMLLIALAASYLPARRASRIDPNTALRHD